MTLADERLRGYERDIAITFKGHEYPAWVLMEHLLRIVDKKGRVVPLILNPQQIDLYRAICEQRRSGEPVRQDILKARQVGYSTFIAALIFLIAMYTPNILAGVAADKLDNAKRIFRKYETFYRHLDDSNPNLEEIKRFEAMRKRHPDTNKPELLSSRGATLMETTAGSRIEVIVADDEAGRGGTYHLLHLTECGFYKNLHETLNGLLETVDDSNGESYVFFETTANGFNEYKERWDADEAGDTAYHATFTPWFTDPEYSDPKVAAGLLPLPKMEEWLYEKQRKHGLSDAQMSWYWKKYRTKGDKGLMLQEYPFSPEDAFRSSGTCVFDTELIAQRLEELRGMEFARGRFPVSKRVSPDGEMIDLEVGPFSESRNGPVWIFEPPKEGHPYILNLDPAMGGEDSYVVQVIDNYELRQVAKFAAVGPRDDEVAFQMVALSRMYNGGMVSAECNNANGTYILDVCRKCGQRLIFQDPGYDGIGDRFEDRYGYKTTQRNKNPMVTMLKLAFQDDMRMISDPATLHEMQAFDVMRTQADKETYKATPGAHDDHVMALCGCLYVRDARVMPFLPDMPKEKKKRGEPAGPFRMRDKSPMEGDVYQRW